MLTEQCPSSFVTVVDDDDNNNNNNNNGIYDQSSLTELSTPDIINEMDAMFSSLIIDNDTALVQKIVDRLNKNFLPRPTLIDPHLPKWLTPLIPIVLSGSNEIAKIIYTIIKIRGYKFISIFLPHQPSSLIDINEKLLKLLLFQKEEEEQQQEEDAWHLKYVYILLATSTLAAPFSISKFTYKPKGDGLETLQSLLEKIYHHLLDVFLGEERGSIGGPLQMASILYCSAILRRKEFSSLKNSFLEDLTEQRSHSKYHLFLKIYDSSSKNLGIALLEKISLCLKEERRPLLSLLLVYVSLLEICTSDFDGLQSLALQKPPTVELKYQWKSTKSLVRTCSPSSLPGFVEHLFRRLKDDLLRSQMPGISQRCNAHLLALYHCTMKVDNLAASFIDNLDIFTDLLNWEGERGHRSVVVRDTSLLLLWSLLRLPLKDGSVPLSAESLKALKVTMLTTLLFDREVSIRRGAIACMQEFLGRWMEDGAEKEEMMVFVDPQSISGHLDDPGSRLMKLIPSLETLSFKKEVVESITKNRIRLGCWDRRHREGLSLSVFPFLEGAAAVPELLFRILKEDGPDASHKHGLVLALSSSLFSIVPPRLAKDIIEFSIKEVLEGLSERSLHFDMLSFAFLKLLISICKVKINNSNSDPRMLDCAWKIISSSKDPRIHALVANGLLKEMSADTVGIESFYREKILPTAHKGRSIHARLASISALGAMPCFLLTKREEPLQLLFATILLSPSIEVRKTMIVAFSKIKQSSSFTFSPALTDLIVESAMSYECDSRGDVGSELRGVSMALLKDLRVEKWKSIAKRHLFDKLDRLRVVALSLLGDVLESLKIGDCIYEPGKFFIAAQSLLGDGNDGIVMSGLVSSSGSMNVLIARHSYSLLKKFSVSAIMEGIKCYLFCLKGRDSVIVGRRTIVILIERIFGLVDDFEGFKDVSGLDVGSYLMDWTTMPKIPMQDLVRLCRIMKYYRSLNGEVDKWCIGWEEMASEINSFTDGCINCGGCSGVSSSQVICDMFKKFEFN